MIPIITLGDLLVGSAVSAGVGFTLGMYAWHRVLNTVKSKKRD